MPLKGAEQTGGSLVASQVSSQSPQQPQNPSSGQPGGQIQHTIHELEPMTRYSIRLIAVNSIGRSRPSVALSLKTEEEGELT